MVRLLLPWAHGSEERMSILTLVTGAAKAPSLSVNQGNKLNGRLLVVVARPQHGVFGSRRRTMAPLSPSTARSAQAAADSTLPLRTGLTKSTRSSLTASQNMRKIWSATSRASQLPSNTPGEAIHYISFSTRWRTWCATRLTIDQHDVLKGGSTCLNKGKRHR